MVVNNAIVLIDAINRRVAAGAELRSALHEAAHSRLRAVLMTTLTTICGMLPTAIGIPDFSLTWSPMATAFCAGLSMATLLTMLVIPASYEILATLTGSTPSRKDEA
jgi:HAE1 family hydrophobic/amphiphilic exporter-1